MKRSVILTDRLGPDILLVLTVKTQVFHREHAHLKVQGCSLVLSAILAKKLPTFLSRLNEISGGCEKILPVLGKDSTSLGIYIINSVDKTQIFVFYFPIEAAPQFL